VPSVHSTLHYLSHAQLLVCSIGDVIVMQDVLDTLKLKGNTSMIGTVTALYVIGGFFGAIIAVMVGALPGQKKTILIGTSIGAVGAIMHITALSAPVMIAGRITVGTGNGINSSTAPLWQSEASKQAGEKT
jgi:MFS family permease